MDLLALDNAQPKLVGGSTSRRITGTVYATSLDASTSMAVGNTGFLSDRIKQASQTADPGTLVAGDLWFRSDTGKLRYYDGSTTRELTDSSTSGIPNPGTKVGGDILQYNGSSWDAVGGDSSDPILGVLYTEGIALKGPAKNIVWMTDGGGAIGGASNYRPDYIYAKTGIYQGANQVLDTSLGSTKNSGDVLQWNGSAWDAKGASTGDRVTGTLYGSAVDLAGGLTFTADDTYSIGASSTTLRPQYGHFTRGVSVGNQTWINPDRIKLYDNTTGDPGSLVEGQLWYNDKGLQYRNASATLRLVDDDRAGAIALDSRRAVTLSSVTSSSLGEYIWAANELLLSSVLRWSTVFYSNSGTQTYKLYLEYWNGSSWNVSRDFGAVNTTSGSVFFYEIDVVTYPYGDDRILIWGRGSTGQVAISDDRGLSTAFFTTANRGLRITARKVADGSTGFASGIMRELRGG